jgi:hypothetical protein
MGKQLPGVFFVALLLAGLLPALAVAAELHFKSDTLFRAFQRDTTTKSDAMVLPAYEYLQADVKGEQLSFHLYGWGRLDFADNDYFEDMTAGELLYGYLEYAPGTANANVKLGRMYVFEGVANEAVDGLRVGSDLGQYFSGSLYAGQPVALDSKSGRDGDLIYGGRISHHFGSGYNLGLSYKKVENESDDAEEMLGVDSSLNLPHGIGFYGFSAYNRETEGWGEHSYELRFRLAEVNLRPYFQMFRYEDYFGTGVNSANPFLFLATTDEELTVLGSDLTWQVTEAWDVGGKFKTIDYDLRGDSSNFYSVLANWHGEGNTAVGGELGLMDGDSAENEYWLTRGYFYLDQLGNCPLNFISGDVVYVSYDQAINNEDMAFFASLGAGKRFLEDALLVKLSGDWGTNPYFDDDLRGLLTISYAFGSN